VLSAAQLTLDRMQTQLLASLATAGVTDVTMTYDGGPLSAQAVTTASTRIPSQPVVKTTKAFGLLSTSGSVEPLSGISEAVQRLNPSDIQLSADQKTAAVRLMSGEVERVPSQGDPVVLDRRAGLVGPTVDPQGYVWSVPGADPSALVAYGPNRTTVPIASAWAEASRITAMALSRDGTRLAAIVTVGGQSVIEVAGVVRSSEGVPQSLGEPLLIAELPGAGVDLTWLDDSTIGALAHGADGMVALQQIVSGPSSSTATPDDATTIAGSVATAVRVRTADGTLYAQRGSNWEQAGTGIQVLATAQGMP